MNRGFSFALWVLVFGLMPGWAWGATLSLTREGLPVRWISRQPQFVANPNNFSGLSAEEVFFLFTHALQRWQQVSQGKLDFQYWQGTDPAVFETESRFNGYSNLYFLSQTDPGRATLDSSILGLTQVWFDSGTGEIFEADIVLNDRDYRFAAHAVSVAEQANSPERPVIALDNVISHELGHAFGLAHSGAMQSTMFFAEGPDQAYPGCDDQIGIARLYPAIDAANRGTIELEVHSPSGQPITGAQVHAISRTRGVIFAGALSDARGVARLSALEPGVYDLLIEPYQAGTGALPEYYRSASFLVCNGRNFSRTWPGRVGNQLSGFRVDAGQSTSIGVQTVSCPASGGADVETSWGSLERSSAPLILDSDHSDFSWLDRADVPQRDGLPSRFFRLKLDRALDLKVISFSAFSPIMVKPILWNSSGTIVPVHLSSPIYRGDSGFINHDLRLSAKELNPGEYFLELRFDSLPVTEYPAGALLRDRAPFFLLMGSTGTELQPPLSLVHPLNSRCRQQEEFSSYRSPAGPPPRRATPTSVASAATGCARGGPGSSGLGGVSGFLVLGSVLRQLPTWLKRLTLRA